MNWWERLTNKSAVEAKKKKGENLNRKERRLLKDKAQIKDVGQSFAGAVINGRTLNPHAVQMAKEWRKKHGIDNKTSRNLRNTRSKEGVK